MITKTKYKKIKTYPRKDRRRQNSSLAPRVAFLIQNFSLAPKVAFLKREIVNQECNIYREIFHLTCAKNMGFQGRKSHKSDIFRKSSCVGLLDHVLGACALQQQVANASSYTTGIFVPSYGRLAPRSVHLGVLVQQLSWKRLFSKPFQVFSST